MSFISGENLVVPIYLFTRVRRLISGETIILLQPNVLVLVLNHSSNCIIVL